MTENDPLRFTQQVLRSPDVTAPDAVQPVRDRRPAGDGRPHRQARPESSPPDPAGGHFAELSRAVEQAHRRLVAANSRYRFCVHREGSEVLIDLVVLGADGQMLDVRQKNITREEFSHWLEHIQRGEGMFFDHRG